MKNRFSISRYNLDSNLEREIIDNHRDYLSWPLVYFLNDQQTKYAYVGETTDVVKRMKAHSKTQNKKDLTEAYNYMGFNYMHHKDFCTAKKQFQKVLELDPINVNGKNFMKNKFLSNIFQRICQQLNF